MDGTRLPPHRLDPPTPSSHPPPVQRKTSFSPVTDSRTRVLILGSLPGEESLRQSQYYAHPQNRFWDLVGAAIGTELRTLAYADRLATLLRHNVGLWDVIADAHRTGSLDSAIRDARGNDLKQLARSLPLLEAIAFNGKKSSATGRKLLGEDGERYSLVDLPSSSPAYAAMPFDEKLLRWAVIGSIISKKNKADS
jgi:double-stranded uracil-DNA glycosylase